MPYITQNPHGDMGIGGIDEGAGGFIPVSFSWIASSVDNVIAVVPRAMRVRGILARPTIAGTDAGAVTLIVRKVPSGTALASGTALHTGTVDLKGTINTNQALTLTEAALDLVAGESIVANFTGVLTAAVGAGTIWMSPR